MLDLNDAKSENTGKKKGNFVLNFNSNKIRFKLVAFQRQEANVGIFLCN